MLGEARILKLRICIRETCLFFFYKVPYYGCNLRSNNSMSVSLLVFSLFFVLTDRNCMK